MCQVIAITNQKGGVGKTTTTFHLGTKLAQEGKRVLLIDADPQASLTASFGIRDADTLNTTLTNALQAIVEDEPIDPAIGIRTHEEGAKLFPANIELASFETAMINVMSREYIMREFVNTHRPNFDYILIDCIYYVTGTAEEADATRFVPNEDGHICIRGMEDDAYIFTEVQTDEGYTLLKDSIHITITADGRGEYCNACGIELLTASATVDGNAVQMEEDDSSVSAIVPLTVVNTKGFDLPQTGDNGVWMYGVIGILAMAASVGTIVIVCRKKKPAENE